MGNNSSSKRPLLKILRQLNSDRKTSLETRGFLRTNRVNEVILRLNVGKKPLLKLQNSTLTGEQISTRLRSDDKISA